MTSDFFLHTSAPGNFEEIMLQSTIVDLANKYAWKEEQTARVTAIIGDKTEQGFEKKQFYHQKPDNIL